MPCSAHYTNPRPHQILFLISNAFTNFESCHGAYFNAYLRDLVDVKTVMDMLDQDEIACIRKVAQDYGIQNDFNYIVNLLGEFTCKKIDAYSHKNTTFSGFVPWESCLRTRLVDEEKRKKSLVITYYSSKKNIDPLKEMNDLMTEVGAEFATPQRINYGGHLEYRISAVDNEKMKLSFKINHGHVYYKVGKKTRLSSIRDKQQVYDNE